MPSVRIRPACRKDLPRVLPMIQALARHHGDDAETSLDCLARDVIGPSPWITLIVAEGEGGLAGYAALTRMVQLQFGVRGMDMHHLFVRSEYRGQGVGQALIRACKSHAAEQSCRFLTVGTHPDNKKAQRFYQTEGFEMRPVSGPRFSLRL